MIHTSRGQSQVKAGQRKMWLQAKGHLCPAGAGRDKRCILPRASEGAQPRRHLDFRLWPPELKENSLLLFKPQVWGNLCAALPVHPLRWLLWHGCHVELDARFYFGCLEGYCTSLIHWPHICEAHSLCYELFRILRVHINESRQELLP